MLEISQHTVHVYVKRIHIRFAVNSRSELLSLFIRQEVIDLLRKNAMRLPKMNPEGSWLDTRPAVQWSVSYYAAMLKIRSRKRGRRPVPKLARPKPVQAKAVMKPTNGATARLLTGRAVRGPQCWSLPSV